METLARSSTSITTTLYKSSNPRLTTPPTRRIKLNSFISIHHHSLFLTLPLKSPHSLLNFTPTRRQFVVNSSDSHHHHHDHHRHDDHHHHHGHHHGGGELTESQKAFVRFAKRIKWTDAANFLRENLELCCCSAVLFVAAAVSPYLVAKQHVKSLQLLFTSVAFPLVAVSLLLFLFPILFSLFVNCFIVYVCIILPWNCMWNSRNGFCNVIICQQFVYCDCMSVCQRIRPFICRSMTFVIRSYRAVSSNLGCIYEWLIRN